jgi:hypothetical protein
MSDVYTPTPIENTSYTRELDGDNGDVASVNPWLQGLSDMCAFLKGFTSAIWSSAIANAGAKVFERGVFANLDQCWYAVGKSGVQTVLQRSEDYGQSWIDVQALNGITGSTVDIACKQSTGDLVIILDATRDVRKGQVPVGAATYKWADTGGNWTASANALSAVMSGGSVDFEATAGKYIAVYRTTTAGMRVDWDADGLAPWTAGTLPTGWATYVATTQDPVVRCIPGRAVACFFDDTGGTNIYRFAYSTDGGATWTGVTKTPTSFNPATITKPAYNPNTGHWVLCGAVTGGGRKTETWMSTDGGATWTSMSNLTAVTCDMALQDIDFINGRLFGVNNDGRLYFSDDEGATWKLVRRNPQATTRIYMRAGGGGLQMWNSTDKTSFTTLRLGGAGTTVA